MSSASLPAEIIIIWRSAVDRLNKVERRLDDEITPDQRAELLAALTAVDDAWEEHIIQIRAWAGA